MRAKSVAVGASLLTIAASLAALMLLEPGQLSATRTDPSATGAAPDNVATDGAAKVARASAGGSFAGKPIARDKATSGASRPATGTAATRRSPNVSLVSPPFPVFDIARISPLGTSVFAGRAAPGQSVSILVDGKVIGTVVADDSGSWVLTTQAKVSNADADLSLRVERPGAKPIVTPPIRVASATPVTGAARASDVNTGMMTQLQGLVDAEREKRNTSPPAAKSHEATEATTAPSPDKPQRVAAASPTSGASTDATAAAATPRIVPLPIQFAFREARLTPHGEQTANLLLQYLLLKSPATVTLSGHADDRGTLRFNMDLSKRRLAAVRAYLRKHGYKGKLSLVAKGKTEPFMGVDRSRFSVEELYQLDRRVELKLAN